MHSQYQLLMMAAVPIAQVSTPVDCSRFCGSVTLGMSARLSGSNSVVESQLPKLLVAGSIPVSRSKIHQKFAANFAVF
jgi:hypothetical protein